MLFYLTPTYGPRHEDRLGGANVKAVGGVKSSPVEPPFPNRRGMLRTLLYNCFRQTLRRTHRANGECAVEIRAIRTP
jgi:hypothetical protein